MRTPLRRVRGLGAGAFRHRHFWHQRVTSVAGMPLTIAFMVIVDRRCSAAIMPRSVQILGSPLVAIIMLLFIINTAYHMWIGMQEIIVDYVHDEKLKLRASDGQHVLRVRRRRSPPPSRS